MGKVLGIVAAVGVSVGMGVAAFTPPPVDASPSHAQTVAPCVRAQLRLSTAFVEGATQSEVLAVSIVNRRSRVCALDGRVSLAIEHYVNGHWRVITAIRHNPSSRQVAMDLNRQHGMHYYGVWQWRNWCGTRTGSYRLLARFGKLTATSKVLRGKYVSSTLPVCVASTQRSTLTGPQILPQVSAADAV